MSLRKILIVEDELLTQRGVLRTLQEWNTQEFEYLTCSNGLEALELLQDQRVHLLITDIKMPGMDGLELLAKLQEQQLQTTTIILTGFSEFEYVRTALKHGVVDYVLKPIDPDKLLEAVEKGVQIEDERQNNLLRQRLIKDDVGLLDKAVNYNKNPAVQQAITYIDQHLREPIGVQEVAAAVFLHPNYFSSLFKEELGLNFSDYIVKRRILESKKLLSRTNMKIYEISDAVGYSTAKYFTKVFHEMEGMTPREYRKSINNEV